MIPQTCSLLLRTSVASSRRSVITAAVKEIQEPCAPSFYIKDSYIPSSDTNYINQVYTVPSDLVKRLKNNLPLELRKQIVALRELGILIRKPAVEIISCLEQTDYTKPVNRYVLYGKYGGGKTTSLVHLIHYGFANQFILIHLPWISNWFRYPKQGEQSPLVPDQIDLPKEGSMWLTYFKELNQAALSNYDLRLSKEYNWNEKESSNSGIPLVDFIDFGITRSKYACGVINGLINEIKIASTAGKCKTLVVIDGFNALISNHTLIRDENRTYIPPAKLSVTSAFLSTVNHNWCNGAVVLTVDVNATKEKKESDYPLYLLGKRGFEMLDPFLPIFVENYSMQEFQVILDYYKERKWIRDISAQGKQELQLLSNKNPFELWRLCRSL